MIRIDPAPNVVEAVRAIEEYVLGEDTQVAFSRDGAFVITDYAVYEVYTYNAGSEVIVQVRPFERAAGWDDITDEVLG